MTHTCLRTSSSQAALGDTSSLLWLQLEVSRVAAGSPIRKLLQILEPGKTTAISESASGKAASF